MSTLILVVSLLIALAVLIKGADLFVEGAKSIGTKYGLSPFIIGVLIVGVGTSLPELASSIAAVMSGSSEIVVANVVGSNITNILLVGGLLALLSTKIVIKQDLLQSELPIFVIATTHFFFILSDGVITRLEAFLLLGTLAAYLWYIIKDKHEDIGESLVSQKDKDSINIMKSLGLVTVGLIAVVGGAHFTVLSGVDLAALAGIPVSIVSILGIAIGTSLPELMVSLKAIKTGEVDMAIGNIFGSNAMNMLLVAGVPALITDLYIDEVVMNIGMHILLASSVIFFVHGLARKMQRWEGAMLLLFFGFFIIQLFEYI